MCMREFYAGQLEMLHKANYVEGPKDFVDVLQLNTDVDILHIPGFFKSNL